MLTELAKMARRQRNTPGRVQHPAGGEGFDQGSIQVEDVDETITWSGHVIVLLIVLEGKGNEEHAIDVLDPKGGKPRREAMVCESFYQVKLAVVHLHLARTEVAGVNEAIVPHLPDRQPFVYGAVVGGRIRRVVHP